MAMSAESTEHRLTSPSYKVSLRPVGGWYYDAYSATSPLLDPLATEAVHLMAAATSLSRPELLSQPLLVPNGVGLRVINPDLAVVSERHDRLGIIFKYGTACLWLARGAAAVSAHPDSAGTKQPNQRRFTLPLPLRAKMNDVLRPSSVPLLVGPSSPAAFDFSWERRTDEVSGITAASTPNIEVGVWQEGDANAPSVTVTTYVGPLDDERQRPFTFTVADKELTSRVSVNTATIERLGVAMVKATSDLPPQSTTYFATGL